MVLKETQKPRRSLFTRTVLYVAAFGLGSLAFTGCMSLTMMAIADGVMPGKDKPASSATPNVAGTPKDATKGTKTPATPNPASKARRGRASQSPRATKKSSNQPL